LDAREVVVPIGRPELFNATEYLIQGRIARGDGRRTALVHSLGDWSYQRLNDEITAAAAGLVDLGVRPEERVLIYAADRPETVAAILAVMHMGAVAVPVSTMLTAQDLAAMLHDSRARVLVTSSEFASNAREAVTAMVGAQSRPDLASVVTIGTSPDALELSGTGLTGVEWSELLAGGADARVVYPTWPDSPALWLYTSGTTGTPKAAMHRHGAIRFVCETYGQQVLGIRPEDRCLSVAKLFFAYGIGNSVFFPFSVGAVTILEPGRPTPDLFAAVAAEHRPTLFFGVPTFYSAMLASSIADEPFRTVRQGASAGEALPPSLFTRIRDRFGFEILDGIGSTEALHIFLSNRSGEIRPGSSGTPVPGYQVQLRDEIDGGLIDQPDRPGALYVSGVSIASGYWCRADASRLAFRGEWLRTGDTYVRNGDGTYSYLGRTDDMIKAGGIWVSPAEVEARLLEHPDVVEVAVVGVPDDDGLEKPVAAVVVGAGSTTGETELVDFCRAGLAAFKRPRRVTVVAELPKTATGKLQRYLVRSMLATELTR
jgi:benzoate-CoA ligase